MMQFKFPGFETHDGNELDKGYDASRAFAGQESTDARPTACLLLQHVLYVFIQ